VAKKKKKWIQGAVKKPGAFTAYCKRQGYGGVTNACIAKGLKSRSRKTRQRASFAKKMRKIGKRRKRKRKR